MTVHVVLCEYYDSLVTLSTAHCSACQQTPHTLCVVCTQLLVIPLSLTPTDLKDLKIIVCEGQVAMSPLSSRLDSFIKVMLNVQAQLMHQYTWLYKTQHTPECHTTHPAVSNTQHTPDCWYWNQRGDVLD